MENRSASAEVVAKAQQQPQSPWFRIGVILDGYAVRRSKEDGIVIRGEWVLGTQPQVVRFAPPIRADSMPLIRASKIYNIYWTRALAMQPALFHMRVAFFFLTHLFHKISKRHWLYRVYYNLLSNNVRIGFAINYTKYYHNP